MTYCLGLMTRDGLVMASDSRTNAGFDQANVCCKMHRFVEPGKRVLVALTSGSLSCTQSVMTLLQRDYRQGKGLAAATNMYDAARAVGQQIRAVGTLDREALARDNFQFNVHILLGGQIGNEPPELYLIYPQGNPLRASRENPYLQIGESKYGRPILDRGVRYDSTTLEEAVKYAMISLDSTMRSNVAVGPPVDLIVYQSDSLRLNHYRRFEAKDDDLIAIRQSWERALRQAVHDMPALDITCAEDEPQPSRVTTP